MKIMYSAWLREHVGAAREDIELPDGVASVGDLVSHLRGLSSGHERALSNMKVVRVAVNQEHSGLDAAIGDGDEVAFFPPVTGG